MSDLPVPHLSVVHDLDGSWNAAAHPSRESGIAMLRVYAETAWDASWGTAPEDAEDLIAEVEKRRGVTLALMPATIGMTATQAILALASRVLIDSRTDDAGLLRDVMGQVADAFTEPTTVGIEEATASLERALTAAGGETSATRGQAASLIQRVDDLRDRTLMEQVLNDQLPW